MSVCERCLQNRLLDGTRAQVHSELDVEEDEEVQESGGERLEEGDTVELPTNPAGDTLGDKYPLGSVAVEEPVEVEYGELRLFPELFGGDGLDDCLSGEIATSTVEFFNGLELYNLSESSRGLFREDEDPGREGAPVACFERIVVTVFDGGGVLIKSKETLRCFDCCSKDPKHCRPLGFKPESVIEGQQNRVHSVRLLTSGVVFEEEEENVESSCKGEQASCPSQH